ncbi:MAG: prepilin-type N-terminal cleavage/methylation domain-containing protein [Calditrichaeota bacterium]|nr:prepilin-type N-terminal cleavage/methylation domain-containing protein [Calditrichota bacterium]
MLIRKLKNKSKSIHGYSLIEMIMVILLFSISMPAIVSMYTGVLTNSHDAEYMTVAELLAVEQMEIILAHKAGTDAGYGYDSITGGRYSSVNPASPYNSWSRSVSVQTVNSGDPYEYKMITVTVNHAMIAAIALETIIFNHPGL